MYSFVDSAKRIWYYNLLNKLEKYNWTRSYSKIISGWDDQGALAFSCIWNNEFNINEDIITLFPSIDKSQILVILNKEINEILSLRNEFFIDKDVVFTKKEDFLNFILSSYEINGLKALDESKIIYDNIFGSNELKNNKSKSI